MLRVAREIADHGSKLLARRRCKSDRGFVEQQQRRIGGERTHDLHHALLAAGERTRLLVREMFDAHHRQQVARTRCRDDSAAAERPAEQQAEKAAANLRVQPDQHVLQCGQFGKQPAVLERAACAARRDLVRRQTGDLFAAKPDAAAIRHDVAGHRIEQRGLAGAVRSDQGADLAGMQDRTRRLRRRPGRRSAP